MRAVDLELLRHGVPSSFQLKPLHVAPVAELALRVAPDDVVVEDARHPELDLGWRALLAYRRHCMRDKGQSDA